MNELQKYNKTIAAVIVGVLGWAASVVTSNPAQITAGEWLQLATVVATALGVYAITNKGTK